MYEHQPAKTLGDLRRALEQAKDFPDDLPIRVTGPNGIRAEVKDFGVLCPPNTGGWVNLVVEYGVTS